MIYDIFSVFVKPDQNCSHIIASLSVCLDYIFGKEQIKELLECLLKA